MNKFDEREKSFEKKFAKDQELQFKVAARSNKYLAEWVSSKLGKSEKDKQNYVQEIRNKVEVEIILVAFDINKSANFLNDNPNEYLRFLKTQKIVRDVDEIHIIDKDKKLLFSNLDT